MLRLASALALLCCVGCVADPGFQCTRSDQCVTLGISGVCEPSGFCSFADSGCPSGRRYAAHAGALSGACVCAAGMVCVADMSVPCSAESDSDFCARLGAHCDSVTAADSCGLMRTASCGSCGASTPVCVAGGCAAPVCGTSFAAAGVPVASASSAGQDVLLGASADGKSVLFLRASVSGGCVGGGASLLIGDDAAGTLNFTNRDLSAVAAFSGFSRLEETMTLSADGLLVTAVRSAGGFGNTKRTALGRTDFAAASTATFTALNAALPAGAVLSWPLLSADGLAFYYRVDGASNSASNGIYEALRAKTSDAFGAGQLMPNVQSYTAVSGMSTDRMTAFVTLNFGTTLLTRTALSQPFSAPSPAAAPPASAYRVVPIGDCGQLLGTCEPGGCSKEDLCVWQKQ